LFKTNRQQNNFKKKTKIQFKEVDKDSIEVNTHNLYKLGTKEAPCIV
jgi:hypothetical protein